MKYIIALKREKRDTAPPDWIDQLREIDGLEALPHASPVRLEVEATDRAIATAKERLGDFIHVEPAISHQRSDTL